MVETGVDTTKKVLGGSCDDQVDDGDLNMESSKVPKGIRRWR